jgi:hypothetical protein
MTFLRGLILGIGIVFIAICVWAGVSGNLMSEAGTVWALPWGKVMLADLYLGFLLIAIIILAFEPLWIGLPVVLLVFTLGNWVTAFWLAARLPKIIRKIRSIA